MTNKNCYIGLMSGTSLDAVDAALIDFTSNTPQLIATHQHEISNELRQHILDLCYPGENAIQRLGEMDVKLGRLFADSANHLIDKTGIKSHDIQAIGSHGQTIRHVPDSNYPFTLQIGDPNIIAAQTGITTVADFRRRDMALGGQAAPLAPAFHNYLFRHRTKNIGVLNIGGIANLTFLPSNKNYPIIGFDTGPGNTLMNSWCQQHTGNSYDGKGQWAASGQCNQTLLAQLLADPYFKKSPPKSTGREHFHLDWLQQHDISHIKPVDVQTTLLELTARSVANSLTEEAELYICGGGAHNTALIKRLSELCHCKVYTTEQIGFDPDWIEAAAFAWLAQQTILRKPGNIPSVTGATAVSILGAIYYK